MRVPTRVPARFGRAVPHQAQRGNGCPDDELFIVRDNTEFRKAILKRLRVAYQFQGARYELSVGAFLTIAGFEVRYKAEKPSVGKSFELTASHKGLSVEFAVEAKSRHRSRAKNPDPRTADGGWNLGISGLLRKATLQLKESTLPGMVFVDLDMPCPMPYPPDVPFVDAVASEIEKAIDASQAGREPELTFLTHHPYHNAAAFEQSRTLQIMFVASPVFAATKEVHSLNAILLKATQQFANMPLTWEDFGEKPREVRL